MAGGDWTPDELGSSTLSAWFKADSITGADGSSVSSWEDSSGNGNNASQATSTRQPTLETNELAGLPVVRFDGTNDILSDSDISALDVGTGDVWVAALFKCSDQSNVDFIFEKGTNQLALMAAKNGNLAVRLGGTNNIPLQTAGNWSRTEFVLVTGSRVSSTCTGFVDGSPMTTTNTTNTGSISNANVFDIGAASVGGNPMQGDIAEILVGGATLSTQNREKIEGYLAWKYGLQANLPSSHTYRFHKPTIDPIRWQGGVNGSLGNALNWSSAAVPTARDKVLFDAEYTANTITGSLTCGSVFVTPSFSGTIGTSETPATFTAETVVLATDDGELNIELASNTQTFVTGSAGGVNLTGSGTNIFMRSKNSTTLALTNNNSMNIDVRHPSGNGGLVNHTSGDPLKTTVGFGGNVEHSHSAGSDTVEITGNGRYIHTVSSMPAFFLRGGTAIFDGDLLSGVSDLLGGTLKLGSSSDKAALEFGVVRVYPGGFMDLTGSSTGQVTFGSSKVLTSQGGSGLKLGPGRSAAMG
tara:strand:+ start:2722 stop:4302 length:1581 start_codon:yes stop_codon:yes gene_type:complete